eukprot:13995784-Alexandrium_andersonii.AAC.1
MILMLRPGFKEGMYEEWAAGLRPLAATFLPLKVVLPWRTQRPRGSQPASSQLGEGSSGREANSTEGFPFWCPGGCGTRHVAARKPQPPWDKWWCGVCKYRWRLGKA